MTTVASSSVALSSSNKPARFTGAVVALLALAIFINYTDRGNLGKPRFTVYPEPVF
jgi:hypothetical protein